MPTDDTTRRRCSHTPIYVYTHSADLARAERDSLHTLLEEIRALADTRMTSRGPAFVGYNHALGKLQQIIDRHDARIESTEVTV